VNRRPLKIHIFSFLIIISIFFAGCLDTNDDEPEKDVELTTYKIQFERDFNTMTIPFDSYYLPGDSFHFEIDIQRNNLDSIELWVEYSCVSPLTSIEFDIIPPSEDTEYSDQIVSGTWGGRASARHYAILIIDVQIPMDSIDTNNTKAEDIEQAQKNAEDIYFSTNGNGTWGFNIHFQSGNFVYIIDENESVIRMIHYTTSVEPLDGNVTSET